jgi:hypothetical protein
MSLEMKFGGDSLQLIPQIEQILDLTSLEIVMRSIILANTLADFQQLI